jgi:hypothetical protein
MVLIKKKKKVSVVKKEVNDPPIRHRDICIERQVLNFDPYSEHRVLHELVASTVHPPSKKRCNYGMRASQTDSSLTKFITNSINIYISK